MNQTSHRAFPLPSVEIGDRLRKARQTAGMTQSQASAAVAMSRPTLVAIEQGIRRAKANELQSLAECYGTGLNRLLSPSAVHLDLTARFRSIGRNRTEITPALSLLNKLASATVELERLLGIQPPAIPLLEQRIVPSAIDRQAEESALTARYALGLGLAPIPDFVALLEDEIGFRVFARELPLAISGVFGYEPVVGACILLNKRHHPDRLAMTAAHELGHYVSNRSFGDIVGDQELGSSNEERFANVFSYAFLMPASTVRRRFQETRDTFNAFTPRHLVSMARSFHVSTQAMCRRLESLDFLPTGTFDSLKERGFKDKLVEESEKGMSTHRSLLPYGTRLHRLAAAALRRELLSEGQVSRMLDLDRVEVRRIVGDVYGTEEVDREIQCP